tara:strand:+ start:563 stop:877 length:315 start_codon:yes stop_codon:yes gene_type:complete
MADLYKMSLVWVGSLKECNDGTHDRVKGGADHEKEAKGEYREVKNAFLSLVEHKQEQQAQHQNQSGEQAHEVQLLGHLEVFLLLFAEGDGHLGQLFTDLGVLRR